MKWNVPSNLAFPRLSHLVHFFKSWVFKMELKRGEDLVRALGIWSLSRCSCTGTAKKLQKRVIHVQKCCFALSALVTLLFSLPMPLSAYFASTTQSNTQHSYEAEEDRNTQNWLRSVANKKTRILIRHVGIYVQVQSSTDRTAVPFSSQQSTTKVALTKATKHKANPATDEVREENRNHGLAWSQTVAITKQFKDC